MNREARSRPKPVSEKWVLSGSRMSRRMNMSEVVLFV